MGASDHGRLNKPKRDAGDVKLGGLGAGIGSLKLLLVPELYDVFPTTVGQTRQSRRDRKMRRIIKVIIKGSTHCTQTLHHTWLKVL